MKMAWQQRRKWRSGENNSEESEWRSGEKNNEEKGRNNNNESNMWRRRGNSKLLCVKKCSNLVA